MTDPDSRGRAWFREETLRRQREAEQAERDRTGRSLSFLARKAPQPEPAAPDRSPPRRGAGARREAEARWDEITREEPATTGTGDVPASSGAADTSGIRRSPTPPSRPSGAGSARVGVEDALALARELGCPIGEVRAREIAFAADRLARERGLSPRLVLERALVELKRARGRGDRG